jgi:hypothetical protein
VIDIITEIFRLTDTKIYDDFLDRILQIAKAKCVGAYIFLYNFNCTVVHLKNISLFHIATY